MPQLIQYLDEIARDKKRDILFLRFAKDMFFNYERSRIRKRILAWFDQNAIPYEECMEGTSDKGGGWYLGEVYLDVPFDTENEQYKRLAAYLEDDKGKVKHRNVGFYIYPYASAINIVPRDYSDSEILLD